MTRPSRSTTTGLPCPNAMPANDTVSRKHPSWRAGNLQAKRLNLNPRPPLLHRTIRIFISSFLSAPLLSSGENNPLPCGLDRLPKVTHQEEHDPIRKSSKPCVFLGTQHSTSP